MVKLFSPLVTIPSELPALATDRLHFPRFCRHADIIFAIGTHSFKNTCLGDRSPAFCPVLSPCRHYFCHWHSFLQKHLPWRQIACIHIQMINILKCRHIVESRIRHNVSDEAGAGAESTTLRWPKARQRLTARHGRPSAAPAARHRCWAASPAREKPFMSSSSLYS